MTARFPGLIFGGAVALYALTGAAAFAQPGPANEGRGPARSTPAHPQDVTTHRMPSQAEQAARLRDVLQLRPAQEPALQAYVAALDSAHRAMAGAPPSLPPGPPPATTPERLARMEQTMARHHSAGAAAIAATRRFYDQLDAGQKRAFDAMPMRMPLGHGGMMRGHAMDGRGIGGPGGPDHRDHLKPAPAPVR